MLKSSLVAMSLFSLCIAAQPAIAEDQNPSEAPVHWTQLLLQPSTTPQLFQGSDHRYNLVYELVATNMQKQASTITQIEVIDKDSGKTIQSLAGKDLVGVMMPVGMPASNKINAGATAIVYMNLTFDNANEAPKHLTHKVTFTGKEFDGKPTTFSYNVADIAVDQKPVLVIASPLRGGKWCAFGGYCGVVGHRRTLFPIDNKLTSAQRYAIDWLRLDKDNYTIKGDKYSVNSSPAYGQPIYAVADGTIYGVVNKFQNQVPFKVAGSDRYSYPAGNSIVLKMDNGLYGMYAHLQPGSIKVKTGDKVKKGDVIAMLGNSGNSTGPHLHFHVVDDPHILASNGVPYVFDKFTLVGEIGDLKQFILNNAASKQQKIAEPKLAGEHQNELVKEGHIVEFQ